MRAMQPRFVPGIVFAQAQLLHKRIKEVDDLKLLFKLHVLNALVSNRVVKDI